MTASEQMSVLRRIMHRQIDELSAEPCGKFSLGESHRLYAISTAVVVYQNDFDEVAAIYRKHFPGRDPQTGQQQSTPDLIPSKG